MNQTKTKNETNKRMYYGVLVTIGVGGGAIVRRFHTNDFTTKEWETAAANGFLLPWIMHNAGLSPDKIMDMGPDVPCAKVETFDTERECITRYRELCVRFDATIRDDVAAGRS
jgi:hypothetical protein